MNVISSGIVYRNRELHCAMPSVVRLQEGSFLCAFRQAPDRRELGRSEIHHCDTNAYIMTCKSLDGESWSRPRLTYAHPLGGCQDPCLFRTFSDTLLCTSYGYVLTEREYEPRDAQLHYGPYAFLGGFLLRSKDEGTSWRREDDLPRLEANMAQDWQRKAYRPFNRGAMVQCPRTGEIFWAVTRHASLEPARGVIELLVSVDDGQSWRRRSTVAGRPGISFNEVSLVITPANKLLAFIRSFGDEDRLYVAESTGAPHIEFNLKRTNCKGSPYHGLLLEDGSIFLTYGYRKGPVQIRALQLQPPAYNVEEGNNLIIRNNGGSWDVGYPWSVRMTDGSLLVVYYWNDEDQERYIAWSKVNVAISSDNVWKKLRL